DTSAEKFVRKSARSARVPCCKRQGGVRAGPGGKRPVCNRGCLGTHSHMEEKMLRKLVIAAATSAAFALAVAPSGASARAVGGHVVGGHVGMGHVSAGHVGRVGGWGRPGFHRFGFHRFHRFGFRRGPFFAGVYGTCWRWVPGPFGWHRVWVCGYY